MCGGGEKTLWKMSVKLKKIEKSMRGEWHCGDKHTQRRERDEGLLSESARFGKV